MVILVDTGSTHHIHNSTIISKTHLTLNSMEQIEVRVANGERIKIEGKLEEAEILVQGHLFTIGFFLLPLWGCDIVLGMQWLKTLGPVLWDFACLTMNFTQDKESIILRGLNPSHSEWVDGVDSEWLELDCPNSLR